MCVIDALGLFATFFVVLGLACGLAPREALAAETWSENTTISSTREISDGVTVNSNITLTIEKDVELTVNGGVKASGKTLTVAGEGTLVVAGANGTDDAEPWERRGGNGVDGNLTVSGGTVTATGGPAGNLYGPGKAVAGFDNSIIGATCQESDDGTSWTSFTQGRSYKRYVTVSTEVYPLWVSGTQVNGLNAADVLADGTVSITPANTEADPATPATLTLDRRIGLSCCRNLRRRRFGH